MSVFSPAFNQPIFFPWNHLASSPLFNLPILCGIWSSLEKRKQTFGEYNKTILNTQEWLRCCICQVVCNSSRCNKWPDSVWQISQQLLGGLSFAASSKDCHCNIMMHQMGSCPSVNGGTGDSITCLSCRIPSKWEEIPMWHTVYMWALVEPTSNSVPESCMSGKNLASSPKNLRKEFDFLAISQLWFNQRKVF